ncbi:hypothetical protein D3C84_1131660 [compost metagenome]
MPLALDVGRCPYPMNSNYTLYYMQQLLRCQLIYIVTSHYLQIGVEQMVYLAQALSILCRLPASFSLIYIVQRVQCVDL